MLARTTADMNWLFELHATQPAAQAIGILAVVCVVGMAVGSITIRGIGLGTAGVLFAGLIVGHYSKAVDHETLDFVKEFGLLLFVFTIGLQLGPGFFSALKRDGLRLNGVESEFLIYPREPHGFSEPHHIVDAYDRMWHWFEAHRTATQHLDQAWDHDRDVHQFEGDVKAAPPPKT